MHTTPQPSRDLLLKIKAHFISKGETLAAWCRANQVHQSHVRQALLGTWDGPKGRAVREKLAREAGLSCSKSDNRKAA